MLRPLDPKVELVQWGEPLSDDDYRQLGDFMRNYPNIKMRVFGHYGHGLASLNFLKYFPYAVAFCADAYNLLDMEGLRYLPSTLRSLTLGNTKKRFSLNILRAFPDLRELYLDGHLKDIDAMSSLQKLERLTLRSVTLPDPSPLSPLPKLWWLAIKLGGTKNLRMLPSVGRLKYLELWRILGLSDIDIIGEVETLQFLNLQTLNRVTRLPSFRKLNQLRALCLETMKGLKDLSPLVEARSLEDLSICDAPYISVGQLAPLKKITSLQRVTFGLGSMRRNLEAEQLFNMPHARHERTGFLYR